MSKQDISLSMILKQNFAVAEYTEPSDTTDDNYSKIWDEYMDNLIFCSEGVWGDVNSPRIYITDSEAKKKESMFPFELDFPPLMPFLTHYTYNNKVVTNIPLCEMLYEFKPNKEILPVVGFDIPEKFKITQEKIEKIRQSNDSNGEIIELRKNIFLLRNLIQTPSFDYINYTLGGDNCVAFYCNDNFECLMQNDIINDIDKTSAKPILYIYSEQQNAIIGVIDPSHLFKDNAFIDKSSELSSLNLTPMDNPIIAIYEVRCDL